MFEQHVVENVVMEYSPGAYERNQKWENYPRYPGMLDLCAPFHFPSFPHHEGSGSLSHATRSAWIKCATAVCPRSAAAGCIQVPTAGAPAPVGAPVVPMPLHSCLH